MTSEVETSEKACDLLHFSYNNKITLLYIGKRQKTSSYPYMKNAKSKKFYLASQKFLLDLRGCPKVNSLMCGSIIRCVLMYPKDKSYDVFLPAIIRELKTNKNNATKGTVMNFLHWFLDNDRCIFSSP